MGIDPCGLGLGILGLASLFKTCVECFDYIHAGQNCGRDFEILLTKLEVEKARLLGWAEAAGILKLQNNGRHPNIDHPIVEKILGSIRAIFHDAREISSRYGLKPIQLASSEHRAPVGLSASLTDRCRESYTRFLLRAGRIQREASTSDKFRWAIHDRSKFQVMIGDLKDLIDGLINLMPQTRSEAQKVVSEQIDSLSDIESLRLVQEACVDDYSDWSRTAAMRMGTTRITSNLSDVESRSITYGSQVYEDPPDPDQEWGEQRSKALQAEIVSLRARLAAIEAVSLSNTSGYECPGISHDTLHLEKVVDRWAANIIRKPPAPLSVICDAIFADVGNGLDLMPQDILPIHAQSLLRDTMFQVISCGIVNIFSITNCHEVNTELTQIYEKLFRTNPIAASFWLRCTLSATDINLYPLPRDIFKEKLPLLTGLLPSLDDTTILQGALSFSRKLCSMSASSDVRYRSFTLEFRSFLDPRLSELAKRCRQADMGCTCKVGATICMGLVKVTRVPVSSDKDIADYTTVVRKARVICLCALVQPLDRAPANPTYDKGKLTNREESEDLQPSYAHFYRSVRAISSVPESVSPLRPELALSPRHSPPPLITDAKQYHSPPPTKSTRRPLPQIPQQASSPNSYAGPSTSQNRQVYDRTDQGPSNNGLNSPQDGPTMQSLTHMVSRLLNEVSWLKTQMQVVQPSSSSATTAADSDDRSPSAAFDTPPPYLRYFENTSRNG